MEAVGPVFETIKWLGAPVLSRIGYVKNLKKNFKKLDQEAKELYSKRDDLNSKVNTASPGKAPSSQFQDWVNLVEETETQMNDIEANYHKEIEKKCFKGWCLDICSRKKLGEDIVDLISRVSDLKKFDSEVMIKAPPSTVEEILVPRIEARTSTDTLRKLAGFIKDPGVKKIGIWGMGGVGKTTLMKNINNLPEIAQMFDIVIWVTVSRDWSLRMVQNEVAQRLSLNLPKLPIDMSDDDVSRRLYHRLKNSRYLLLLDDVWENLNLVQVGIPIPDEENGCKILLATRDRQICHKMETDTQIRVEVLSEEEAWELFREKAGSTVDSPEIQPLAREVVEECRGLPLAIIVVGGALREEGDVRVWRNASRELSSAVTSQIKDMEEEVFKRLRFSYDRLKGDRQRCFLYGALYPEDHEIDAAELIEYWRAAGFLEDDGGAVESLAEAYDAGHAILKDLVDSCLLERRQGREPSRECVKMHDVIRDLALRITSIETEGGSDNKFLVRAGMGIETPPGDEQWKECTAVSLMHNYLDRLPERTVCPVLSTLLLQGNPNLEDIPSSFFEAMPALQVLDLSNTGIRSLPPAICSLVSLRGIYLNGCGPSFEIPPEIGAVKGLEVLQIGGESDIPFLPITVGELTRLKCLHVVFSRARGNGEVAMIPRGIVSRLSLLEDLRIEVRQGSELDWDRNLEAYLMEEFCGLKELTHLEFRFTRVGHLQRFVDSSRAWHNGKLSHFTFIVGYDPIRYTFLGQYSSPRAGRILQFEGGDGAPPQAIKQVLCRAEWFVLSWHIGVRNLLGEFGAENMVHLKYLEVQACDGIESMFIDRDCSFLNLERLHIRSMGNLRDVWELDRLVGMVNLRVLELSGCHRLQKVLPRSVIQLLPNLEELWLLNCGGIKETVEGGVVEYNAFPKLKKLDLVNLPGLESVCEQVLAWPSIEEIHIYGCWNLRRLPFGIHNTSTLNKIRCEESWWDALQWEDEEIKTRLQHFASFFGY